jgi:hypothetical protein
VVQQAIEFGWRNCGTADGEAVTPAHIQNMSALVVEKLQPYLVHLAQRRRQTEKEQMLSPHPAVGTSPNFDSLGGLKDGNE